MIAAPGGLTLEVRHQTVYDYGAPVSLAQHQAHLRPLSDPTQTLLEHHLDIVPRPVFVRDSIDAMGNAQVHFSLAEPHTELRVTASSLVRVSARFQGLRAEEGPAWEPLAERLRFVARPGRDHFEPAIEFVQPSPYVPRLPELRAYAQPSFPPGRSVAVGALDLMHRVHADFAYQSLSTQVDTPLADAFAQRRGVCQDFAHLLIGGLRMLGLPARYVSGYLLTQPPEGGSPLLGADASHAWVQVWCPGTPGVPTEPGPAPNSAGWLSLDPTNDVVPGAGHVRLAIGRDFGDVTPLRGVIRGGGRHRLAVAVSTRIIDDTPVEGGERCVPGQAPREAAAGVARALLARPRG